MSCVTQILDRVQQGDPKAAEWKRMPTAMNQVAKEKETADGLSQE